MKSVRGFTLIELMVSIAVLGIIAAMAVPSFKSTLARQRLELSTRELANTLRTARSQAILTRRITTVNLNSTDSNTALVFNWKAKNATLKSQTATTIYFNEKGLTVQDVTSGTVTTKTPTAATFVLCSANINELRIINVLLTGTVESVVTSTGTC